MKQRILIVDAIRGFALFGILIIHSIEQFDLANYPESLGILSWLDPMVKQVVFFIFASKSYSIFSIMFGFSFYIQMKNKEEQGIDFSFRFIWRLILLFIIGYLYSLFYIGEVLTIFALLGLILVPMYKLNTKWLIFIGILFLIQLPLLYGLGKSIISPTYEYTESWHYWDSISHTFINGSFLDVIKINSFQSHLAKWQYMHNTGRYIQMIGLFIIGLLAGRNQYFTNIISHKNVTLKIMVTSAMLFGCLYYFPLLLDNNSFTSTQNRLLLLLSQSYLSLAFTIFLITLFILIYLFVQNRFKLNYLSYYGRMSLTNYVTQAVFGTIFFYGYGFGMYRYFGITFCLLYGLVFFIIQVQVSKICLSNFYYGPLEWLWRALTFSDFRLKFKKKN